MLEQIDLHCSLPIQLLLCVNIIVNKRLTTSVIKYVSGQLLMPVTLATLSFYHIGIPKIIF